MPTVVVVGSACRDIAPEDPRGWRLGGGVTYGALTTARLGLRTAALVGVDEEAADAFELDLLRAAGVDLVRVPLARAPVFENRERPTGRVQTSQGRGDPVPVSALPDGWREAPGWILAPVASELPDVWANVPRRAACVAFGWQGILRDLPVGDRVRPSEPGPSPFLARADIVGVSRHDLSHDLRLDDVRAWMGEGRELLLTCGDEGGLVMRIEAEGRWRMTGYPALPPRATLDPTGAGDVMLAALLAARLAGGGARAAGRAARGHDLRVAAAAASLVVERPGTDAVPTLAEVRERLRQRSATSASATLPTADLGGQRPAHA